MSIGYIMNVDLKALLNSIISKKETMDDVEYELMMQLKRRAKLKIERIIDSCKTGDQVRMTLDMIDMFYRKFNDSLTTADLRERMSVQTERMCLTY